MACSKPIRAPREWTKFMKEATSPPEDKELFCLEEIINWAIECELCDEHLVKKYSKKIRPYHLIRAIYPVIPDDTLCRELFKVFVHFALLLFIADDQMELQSEEEMRNICAGFARLDDLSRESFPEFHTVEEMKKIASQMSTPSIVGPTVFFANFVNEMASVLLKHGNYAHDVVYDFRLRASNMNSLYIQAVTIEKHKKKPRTLLENFWRHLFSGCAFPSHLLADVFSGALGMTKQHIELITEIYIYSSIFCMPVNDFFSYLREKAGNSDNMFRAILRESEENIPEAAEKIAQIAEVALTCVYEKIQEALKRHPDIPELCSLFDYLSRCALGWFWAHRFAVPRYQESTFKFTLVEVDDENLSSWLSEKRDYGDVVIKEIVEMVNTRMADGKMDALRGAFPIHKKVSAFKKDGLYEIE